MQVFSKASLAKLKGVHPDLVKVITRALESSEIDFTVVEGLRTPARQKELLAKGATRTLNSKHIKQKDGYSHAVDIAPVIGGDVRWDWPLFHKLAIHVRDAAIELDVRIRWGGCWDRCLNDIATTPAEASRDYCARHPGPDFIDGPHFELRTA